MLIPSVALQREYFNQTACSLHWKFYSSRQRAQADRLISNRTTALLTCSCFCSPSEKTLKARALKASIHGMHTRSSKKSLKTQREKGLPYFHANAEITSKIFVKEDDEGNDSKKHVSKNPDKKLPSFNELYVSNYFDGADPFASVKAITPIQVLIGIGVILAALLPTNLALVLAAILILPSIVRVVFQSSGLLRNPHMDRVIHDKVTARVEGDFCVLLIGARNNAPWKPSAKFTEMGRAFEGMIKELEALPVETTGFMGAENFVSTNLQRSSQFMTVVYWRTYEDLVKFAHNDGMTHLPAWLKASKTVKESAEIGLWHEAYHVKGGNYDTIYINCPPLGLGMCGKIEPAVGQLRTSRGRSGASKGNDWTDSVS